MKNTRPLTTLELAILGLVHAEPKTGYDLCKIFESTPMGHYSSSPGSLYPALKRLETRGVISGQVQREKSLRPRKLYEVTPEGARVLEERLSEPVTRDDLVWAEDEILLRFGFMGAVVSNDVVIRFLESLAQETDALVGELKSHLDTMTATDGPGGKIPTPRLALSFGIESYRTLARWARTSLKEIQAIEQGRRSVK